MFYIRCIFEAESGLDVTNPLGNLQIGDDCSELVVPTTYLDSWLEALVNTIPKIRGDAELTVSIPEEPEGMQIKSLPNGAVSVRFKTKRVLAASKREFEDALRNTSLTFLSALGAMEGADSNPAIVLIRKFCSDQR